MAGAVLFLLKRNLLPESGLEIENACQGQSVRRSDYDPEIRRFISADDVSVLENDRQDLENSILYAYCFNNPTLDELESSTTLI